MKNALLSLVAGVALAYAALYVIEWYVIPDAITVGGSKIVAK